MYDFITRNAEELLHPDGPVQRFASLETRVIVRPTAVYYSTLKCGTACGRGWDRKSLTEFLHGSFSNGAIPNKLFGSRGRQF